jgi:hypothetical protein
MPDQTADEIAAHYVAMGHSVDLINAGQVDSMTTTTQLKVTTTDA